MKEFGWRKRIEHQLRVWLGRAYRPAQVEDLGATMFGGGGYGAWPCLAERLHRDSVVYSVGIGFDVQFDVALIERFGLTVHGFDPTPRVAEWLQNNPPPDALKFYPLGLAWTDGELQFAAPTEAEAAYLHGGAVCVGGSNNGSHSRGAAGDDDARSRPRPFRCLENGY